MAANGERFDPDTLPPINSNVETIRLHFPQVFVEGKIDFALLRGLMGDAVDARTERYSFTWAGKGDAIRSLQAPTHATLQPLPHESIDWHQTNNLFIEGDNLEVLKLLYKGYFGRIKLIYIDPPYNTGKEFVYPDNYADPLGPYLHLTGQVNSAGALQTSNTESAGRYHSSWLNMMHPRLFIARQLLKEDGLIIVSIDDNEVHNLRLLLNEIFGAENFVTQFVWNSSTAGGIRAKFVNQNHEYALCYARSIDALPMLFAPLSPEAVQQYNRRDERGLYREKDFAWVTNASNPNQDYLIACPDGSHVRPAPGYQFRFVRERFQEALSDDLVVFKRTDTSPLVDEHGNRARWNIYIKKYLEDGTGAPSSMVPKSLVGISNVGTAEIKDLFGARVFDNPKSTQYLNYFLQFGMGSEDTVLDFFAGSCSTAHAVMKLNAEDSGCRRFIVVQLPEPTPVDSVAAAQGFATIADIGKERIRRAIQSIRAADASQSTLLERPTLDLGFRAFKLVPTHFKGWAGIAAPTSEQYMRQLEVFTDPIVNTSDPESVIWEVAIKEGFSLASKIETVAVTGHVVYRVTDPDHDRYFHVCLESQVAPNLVIVMKLTRDDLFICRDSALDDSAAANFTLQCRLKTI
jgi:adenine-specific DNA-methyltransferase